MSGFDALVTPLAIDSMMLQQKPLVSAIPTDMLGVVRHVGLEGICVLPGPMRSPAGIAG